MDIKNFIDNIPYLDPVRAEGYMRLFDRMILYLLAANVLPQEGIDHTIDAWNKAIKGAINEDVNHRANFLENTPAGRKAKFEQEMDGEDLRLACIKSWKFAEEIIKHHLSKSKENDNPDSYNTSSQ